MLCGRPHMSDPSFADLVGPQLGQALTELGFVELTAVQKAVLEPNVADFDLRITSQTGSGKTVAIGLLLRDLLGVMTPLSAPSLPARPLCLLLVPTRELAKQVRRELSALYHPFGVRIGCTTGGTSYRDERRSLSQAPKLVVGTPGRLLDHLREGTIDASEVHSIVLDEADRMLDLGFSEDLEAIFALVPDRKHTHMVSATLEGAVLRLADRYQTQPRQLRGTMAGRANLDIEHVAHVVAPARRLDALVNLLLCAREERTLVFVRTRKDVVELTDELGSAGFLVRGLSGDMEQRERDRALADFRDGRSFVMVATDVAARGIDVQDTTRVIHYDPPTDPDSYTHRSGRTGRAGKKGKSIILIAPGRERALMQLLNRATIRVRFDKLPGRAEVLALLEQRELERWTTELDAGTESPSLSLAERLLSGRDPVQLVSRLLDMTRRGEPAPREFVAFERRTPPPRSAHEQRGQGPRPSGHGAPPRRPNGARATDRWLPDHQAASPKKPFGPENTRPWSPRQSWPAPPPPQPLDGKRSIGFGPARERRPRPN
jgi:ATP-dependent RNA helicase DeaD